MGNLHDLMLLVILGSVVAVWLQLSRAREIAVLEARRLCERHGLQLLDETVGLRGLRVRPVDGLRRVERCYGFDVSLDGDDRQHGRLWMVGTRVTELELPTTRWKAGVASPLSSAARHDDTDVVVDAEPGPGAADNVIPLHPRLRQDRPHR